MHLRKNWKTSEDAKTQREDKYTVDIGKLRTFYQGKRVLLTGHTGFKGSWLCVLLAELGAQVYGYALEPPSTPSLFEVLFGKGAGNAEKENLCLNGKTVLAASNIADIRDFEALRRFYDSVKPDVVLHLAAQPIVRTSYRIPRETYETNVMGTVNLLECVRRNPCCKTVLNVTTDKVYRNEERPGYGYQEDDKLDGFDPYSNSKSCSELVTHSYRSAFLEAAGIAVSTARAGNVIGGGDFAEDRIIPDCVRAAAAGQEILVRNPYSTRPYQHVLEPLLVYLMIAAGAQERPETAGWYNVGPDDCDCVTTGALADLFVKHWGSGITWYTPLQQGGPHEANFLKLDNHKVKDVFGWRPVWHIEEAVAKTTAWSKAWLRGEEAANQEMLSQIREYLLAAAN